MRKGSCHSEEARAKNAAAHHGRVPWNKGIKMNADQCVTFGKRRGFVPWNKGIPTGISPMRGPRPEYNGVRFRSSYEVRFAKALDARGIGWQYEPKRFVLGSCSYLPDFFVPETGAFWEIKGWHNASSQMKARLFRELYPEHPLIIATHDVITMMEGSTKGSRHVEDLRSPGLVAQ